MDAKELEALDPLHNSPVDVDGVFSDLSPIVYDYQLGVNRVHRRGLSTHPWGAPVLRVSVAEVVLPTLITWGRPVRKSRSQLQREVFSPRFPKLSDELGGGYGVERWALVNEQLSHVVIFLLSMWKRAVWSAIEIASSVDLLGRYGNWVWVQGVWDDGVDVCHEQPFKALQMAPYSLHSALLLTREPYGPRWKIGHCIGNERPAFWIKGSVCSNMQIILQQPHNFTASSRELGAADSSTSVRYMCVAWLRPLGLEMEILIPRLHPKSHLIPYVVHYIRNMMPFGM